MKIKKIIGRLDKVDLPDFGVEDIQAKIDTGAYPSSLHCKKVRLEGDVLKFQVKVEAVPKRPSKTPMEKRKIASL